MNNPIISLNGVTKVFLTDDVETHALSEISLTVEKGEYVSISGPSGCGKSTLLSILGLLDTPTQGTYTLNQQAVADLDFATRARIRNREVGFIFSKFQPDRGTFRFRKRGASADLPRDDDTGAKATGCGGAGKGRHVASCQASSVPALRRSAATRRSRTGAGRSAVDSPGR